MTTEEQLDKLIKQLEQQPNTVGTHLGALKELLQVVKTMADRIKYLEKIVNTGISDSVLFDIG